jgi:hypothetical protein
VPPLRYAQQMGVGIWWATAKIAPPPQVPQLAGDTVSAAEESKLILIGVGVGSIRKCQHGVYLIEDDQESGNARYCSICTQPPVITCPVYRPSASKLWGLKLKYADLDFNRGMSLRDSAGTLGKNLVCGGGAATSEFNEWRTQDESEIPSRRRTAAGQDKIRPGQNPNVDVDDEGCLPPSSTRSLTKSLGRDMEARQITAAVDRGFDRRKIVRVEETAPFDDPDNLDAIESVDEERESDKE